MGRKRTGRTRINLWLPDELLGKIETQIGKLGRDRTEVVEVILDRFWDAQIEIKDAKAP